MIRDGMTLEERILYHQIHPLKLIIDWGTGILALYPFWLNHFLLALLLTFVPSIIVSVFLVRFADLEKYRQSSFGQYLRQYMTRPVELLRFAGYVLMALSAWYRIFWFIPAGLLVIVFAWLRGVLFPGWK